MLPLDARDDDHGWTTEDAPPSERPLSTLALRLLCALVERSPAVITLTEDAPLPEAGAEIREVVVARGIEVRSPLRLLRWPLRPADAPEGERPRRA